MPTLTIHSDLKDPTMRGRFCRRVTVTFGRLGVDVRHVLTRWLVIDPSAVFSGPAPLARSNVKSLASVAFIAIEVDQTRERSWRDKIVEGVLSASKDVFPHDRLFIRLIPVDPFDHWNVILAEMRDRAVKEGRNAGRDDC
ncbi:MULTISPECIES: hypothetical protein [unclassified Bradyrhizobium]|uniref:hypothetical protein n=1 Tax=Bradyrhizobium TaxID=374 RepID=UPI0028E74AEF|nr:MULTISPECIES: hypothetical protein [unclassified Bradyrhizobium]